MLKPKIHEEGRNVFINRKNGGFKSYFITGSVSSTKSSSITMSKQTDVRYTALNYSQVGKPRKRLVTDSGVR